MPELSCGCILLRESIRLQKEIRDDNDKFVEYVSMTHDYYHLVDKTGNNQKKVELFNKGEELRMNMTKRLFNILVDEQVYDVDDDDDEEDKRRNEELGNKKYINGLTFNEMMETYIKYHGLKDKSEVKQEEFDKWIDVISRKYLNEKFGTIPDEEYDEMIKVIKKYCDEKGCEPIEIDIDEFNEWVEKSDMPMSANVKQFLGKRTDKPRNLNGITLAEFRKRVKVVPVSESSEEEEEEEEENMTDPYNYMSPKSKAQYDRDVEKRWKEEEEEEKQEKRRQKCINKQKQTKNTPQNK